MTSAKKMFGDLPPSSSVTGMMFSEAYCMISRPVVVSPVKAILAMRLFWRQRLAGLDAEAVDDVEHAGRQEVGDQLHQHQDAERRLLGRLEHDAVAGGERRRQLPGRHQQREVPGNDLADDAERLVEVIGDGVVVDLGDAAFLRADAAGEIAEMVDASGRSAAVVSRIGLPLSSVSTSASRSRLASMRSAILLRMQRALGWPRCGPRRPWRRGRRRAPVRCPRRSERAISQSCLPVIGRRIVEVLPATGATHLPPMKLS